MLRRLRLIPLLAAALVIQSLVAVLPHDHGPTPVEGRALQAPSQIDAPHHCLACSAHAPVVELAAELGHAAGTTPASPVSVECGSTNAHSVFSIAGPRGPPGLV